MVGKLVKKIPNIRALEDFKRENSGYVNRLAFLQL